MMKKQNFIFILALVFVSCSTDKTPEKAVPTKENNSNESAKKELFANVELLVGRKIKFEDVSISYDELYSKLSPDYQKRFLNDEGAVMKIYLPRWKKEAEVLLHDLCTENDINFTESNLKLDKAGKELKAYTYFVSFQCKTKSKQLRIGVFEVGGEMYLTNIQEID